MYWAFKNKSGLLSDTGDQVVCTITMLSDTGDQVVCTVGQTDGHISPDHTMSRADVEWDSLGPQATLLMHPSGPTVSEMVQHGFTGSAKSRL